MRGVGPDAGAGAWVESVLTPEEFGLWKRLSDYDQNHAVRVARGVQHKLAGTPYADDNRWLAAALMHDIGKLEAGLPPHRRVVAALAGWFVGPSTATCWAKKSSGFIRRIGLYLTHGPGGAEMIRLAGGRHEAVEWARVHQDYEVPASVSIPAPVVQALSEADDE